MIAGVGAGAPRSLAALAQDRPGELVFAEALSGDRFALDAAGRVLRYDPGADERALAGSTFDRWLDATVAREQILFGPDGEYAPDVFDPLAQEIVPTIALRQAERALKVDPGAADSRARARAGAGAAGAAGGGARGVRARRPTLDADNPWPWFDLGRTALALGRAASALPAFRRAAAAASEARPRPGCWRGRFAPPARRATKRRSTALRAEALARRTPSSSTASRAAARRRRRRRRRARRGARAAGGGRARARRIPAAPVVAGLARGRLRSGLSSLRERGGG